MFNYILILINGIPVKLYAIWNFNKLTSIKDISNLEIVIKFTQKAVYLIAGMLAFNVSTMILDNYVIQPSIVFIAWNIKEWKKSESLTI